MGANLNRWAVASFLVLCGAGAHAQSFGSQSGITFNGASQSGDLAQSFNAGRNQGGPYVRGIGNAWANGWGNGNGNPNAFARVSPIPEPSTYVLMLAGLGAVAFVARRRRAG